MTARRRSSSSARPVDQPTPYAVSSDAPPRSWSRDDPGTNDVPVISGPRPQRDEESRSTLGQPDDERGAEHRRRHQGQSKFTAQAGNRRRLTATHLHARRDGPGPIAPMTSQARSSQLGAGQSITDSFTRSPPTAPLAAGHRERFHGTNDVPVISGFDRQLDRGRRESTSRQPDDERALSIVDVDQGHPISRRRPAPPAITATHLHARRDGAWTYSADDSQRRSSSSARPVDHRSFTRSLRGTARSWSP